MTERIKVWPAPGLSIRDEFSLQHIGDGDEVVKTRLTDRRLARGDLLQKDPRPAEPTKKTKKDEG